MYFLEYFEEVLEIMRQGLFQMRNKARRRLDRALIVFQPFLGDPSCFKSLIEEINVSVALQEFQIGLTDDYIVGRGIIMELLMPFLHKMSCGLFDIMAVHYIQYLVTDPLRILPRAESRHCQADELPLCRLINVAACQFVR